MANLTFDTEKCKGCGLCINACPKKLIRFKSELNSKGFHSVELSDSEACIGCAFCAIMCPDVIITVEKEDKTNV